jgi:uroporphyrinogen decarboxylase
MRQAGRYLPEYREVRARAGSFLDLCYSPRLAADVTLQPIRRFGFDAAIIFSDILVIPHALGQKVEFLEGEGPKLDPIRDGRALAKLDPDMAQEHLAPVFEAIRLTCAELGPSVPLIGFCGAPWTVATYMIEGHGSTDQQAAKMLAFSDPEIFTRILDLLVETSAAYLIAQIEAGARVLQIFDSWAGSLADDGFRQWVIEPTAALVAKVRSACPAIPIIGFPRGAAASAMAYLEQTGVDGVGCDTAMPLNVMLQLRRKAVVQGNLDPLLLVAGGDAMELRISAILAELRGKSFIFNLGHGIVPQTPIAHVERLVQLVRSSG